MRSPFRRPRSLFRRLHPLFHRLRSLLRGIRRRAELDAEMDEEFRFHLERRAEDLMRAGLSPAEARRRARAEFGSTEQVRDEGIEARGLRYIDELRIDVRHLLRGLSRDRTFGLAVVLTLGVCIAANVAVYSVVETVVLSPLPYREPDRLVTLYNSYPGLGADRLANSLPDFFLRRERVEGLEEVALHQGSAENVGEGASVDRVPGLRVTPSFFPTLGVEAALGRTFREEEMTPGQPRPVVLTHTYWRERFAGSADVLGRTLRIDGQTATIVGVLPESFRLPTHPDARLVHPLVIDPWGRSLDRWHSNNNYLMLGRLAPAATVESVEREIAAMNAGLIAGECDCPEATEVAGFHTVVVDAHADLVRNVEDALYLLWGAVVFVLLIGCVNVANLTLARSQARLPELATRAALGAGRVRLARQMLTEAVATGLLGGVVGLGLGAIALRLFTLVGVPDLPRGAEVGLHAPAVLYAAGLTLGAAVLVGVVPIPAISRSGLAGAVLRDGRGTAGSRLARLVRSGLVVAQVGLAFLLLVGAGLMLRSFQAALEVDPGFEPEGVHTARTALTGVAYPDGDARRRFYDEWLGEVRALPGVAAAGVTSQLPFGSEEGTGSIVPEGYERSPGEAPAVPRLTVAGPGYFEALGIEVLEGRTFQQRDGPGQPAVIVIDERLARRYWPDGSPLGQRMTRSGNLFTVIGVVEAIRYGDLTAAASESAGAFYYTYRQRPTDDMALVARTAAGRSLTGSLRAALDRVDPEIPLFDVRPLDQRVAGSLGSRRAPMILLVVFANVALFLAAVGIYGVLAYSVARRTREIGIRMALGGRQGDILGLVLKQGLVLAGTGLAAGGLAAAVLVRLIRSLLFGVRPLDPTVLAATAALLGLAALVACVIPARRATRVDPVSALAR